MRSEVANIVAAGVVEATGVNYAVAEGMIAGCDKPSVNSGDVAFDVDVVCDNDELRDGFGFVIYCARSVLYVGCDGRCAIYSDDDECSFWKWCVAGDVDVVFECEQSLGAC